MAEHFGDEIADNAERVRAWASVWTDAQASLLGISHADAGSYAMDFGVLCSDAAPPKVELSLSRKQASAKRISISGRP